MTNPLAWPLANAGKPLGANLAPNQTWPYNYFTVSPGPDMPLQVVREDADTNQTTTIEGGLFVNPNNNQPGPTAHEIMAFVSRANEQPIGTKDVSEWFNTNINIVADFNGLDPASRGLVPDESPNHSFQFNHDTAITWNFWERVKEEIAFTSTYDA